ncbi:putative transcription factor C2H2 family [Helianthus annuus]|nr:putative transcription factor C2H2 family [Helianthus annuus]
MPKERRDRSVSIGKSKFSPYRCSTSQTKQSLVNSPLENEESLKEWEDTRCPVCMEHPHNAILLLCSSHNNGCRPYMCDTSYRHSNCFDQFRKTFSESHLSGPSTEQSQSQSQPSIPLTTDEKSKMVCPLCRGEVNGWVVVDPARLFMNTKTRSCASETCDFTGTYKDLRKHARLVHPFVRPSEVDPTRQQDWRRMERRRDLGDLLSTLQSSIGEERELDEDSTNDLSFDDGGWLTVFFLIRVFQPGNRALVSVQRRTRRRLWGERSDGEVRDGDVDGETFDSESGSEPGPRSLFQFSRRPPASDDDDDDES